MLALIGLIVVALAFDFLNGVHDTANSIATIVATRKLQPRYAVAWAAFFNFVAFLVFGVHVARTVGVGIVSADVIDPRVIFAALMGAIVWNLITWWGGIPSSSSHALIGGLVGAGVTKAGIGSIVWSGLLTTGAFIVLSPMIGSFLLYFSFSWSRGFSCGPLRVRQRVRFNGCNLPQRLSFRLVMVGMMRKRLWGSLPCCCFRKVSWVATSLSPSG